MNVPMNAFSRILYLMKSAIMLYAALIGYVDSLFIYSQKLVVRIYRSATWYGVLIAAETVPSSQHFDIIFIVNSNLKYNELRIIGRELVVCEGLLHYPYRYLWFELAVKSE